MKFEFCKIDKIRLDQLVPSLEMHEKKLGKTFKKIRKELKRFNNLRLGEKKKKVLKQKVDDKMRLC